MAPRQTSRRDVAVIIVTYRSAELTIAALRSVESDRASSAHGIRAVVVDNASGDLPEISSAIEQQGWSSWVTAVQAPRNGGFAYGNNLGISRACSAAAPDYVYLLNPDAQVRAGAIDALVRFLELHPAVGIAGSEIENIDGSEWPMAFRFPSLLSELNDGLNFGVASRLLARWLVPRKMGRTAEPVDWICGASMMIRPAVFAAIGGLDENYFLYFEETDFCRRASLAGFQTWYVPESRVRHMKGQSTGADTDRTGASRLPAYWFESRRRYFALAFGIPGAMVIDFVAVSAHALGYIKRILLNRRHTVVPHFTRDLLAHSIVRTRNRKIPPPRVALLAAQHLEPPGKA